jgi:hypothetical protein
MLKSINFPDRDTTLLYNFFKLNYQEKLSEELFDIFGSDRSRAVTVQDTTKMKYMECCIKEALRLFPSGPFYGRFLHEDLYLGEDGVPGNWKPGTSLI